MHADEMTLSIQTGHLERNHFIYDRLVRHAFRITSYNVCYTKLLRIPVAADAFNIFVFMEISSLASYVIIAGGSDRRALPAVFKYLIMGTIGATFSYNFV